MGRWRFVWTAVLLAAAACGSGGPAEPNNEGAAPPSSTSSSSPSSSPPGGSPAVAVAVEGRTLGPLSVTAGAPRPAPANEANSWIQHDVTITNGSDSIVYLNDFRQSLFLGDQHALLAGVGGCGYGSSPGEPVAPACTSDYRPLQVRPHASHTIEVTLWKGLAGMGPLQPGRYVLEQPVQYRQDRPFDDPRQAGTSGTIVLTYTVT